VHFIKEVGQFFSVLWLRVDEWLDGLQGSAWRGEELRSVSHV